MKEKRADVMIHGNIVTHHYAHRMLIATQKKNIRTRAYTHIQSLFPSVFGNHCLPLNYIRIYLVYKHPI